MNALLSVSDKTGIVDFARALHALGIKLISTGGTAKLLAEQGLPVTEVAEVTQFPEMLDGRVKTLHPKVHGGILARRNREDDTADLAAHGIGAIDMVVGNLYPFVQTVTRENVPTLAESGVKGLDASGITGLLAPAKTPQPILDRLHREIVKVVRAPEMKAQLEVQGYDPVGGTPAEFAAFIRAESEKYAKVIKLSGAKID